MVGNAADPANWSTGVNLVDCGVLDPFANNDQDFRHHLYCISQ